MSQESKDSGSWSLLIFTGLIQTIKQQNISLPQAQNILEFTFPQFMPRTVRADTIRT